MPDLVTPIAAFALGAALARANSCTVASARRLVLEGRTDWLVGLGVAIGWAGLTLAAFGIALPNVVVLPAQAPVAVGVLAGGLLLGIGATINQGCFLGSIARLGRGDLSYVFTLLGIALAMAYAPDALPSTAARAAHGPPAYRPAAAMLLTSLIFAPFALYGLRRWWIDRRQPMLALIAVGISGGTVYA